MNVNSPALDHGEMKIAISESGIVFTHTHNALDHTFTTQLPNDEPRRGDACVPSAPSSWKADLLRRH